VFPNGIAYNFGIAVTFALHFFNRFLLIFFVFILFEFFRPENVIEPALRGFLGIYAADD
jgi:hypothetical protein